MDSATGWSTDDFRRQGSLVLEALARFVEESTRGKGPVVDLQPVGTLIQSLEVERLMADGMAGDKELEAFLQTFLEGATRLHHPAYLAHQIALPHYASALGDLISGILNNGMSVYEMGPTAGALEVAVIDWMLEKVGWEPTGRDSGNPPSPGGPAGGGVLTHGGSMANLTALLAARAASAPKAWQEGTGGDLVVVAPGTAHYSLSRATAIMGMGTRALVGAPSDPLGRLIPDQLPAALRTLTDSGKAVMAVCANACATATGIYDPLQEVGAVCQEEGVWLHVDGAHGASALLHPEERRRLAGVTMADSLTWDAHKLLQTSALCAAILFRDGRRLMDTFRQDAAYVTEGAREIGHDFIGHQLECTKSPLGLKLFLVLAMVGEEGLASNVGALSAKTRRIHDLIVARPAFQVLSPPESNILCFRRVGDDALQIRIRQQLMREGDILLSQADVAGRRWLRMTVMNPLTDDATVNRILDHIETLD
ncbi:MAG: pyridoxal phosphate-dependent decarboxylase family protein [Gemmatimonadota bacterium]